MPKLFLIRLMLEFTIFIKEFKFLTDLKVEGERCVVKIIQNLCAGVGYN
jgi:hypothetical protein